MGQGAEWQKRMAEAVNSEKAAAGVISNLKRDRPRLHRGAPGDYRGLIAWLLGPDDEEWPCPGDQYEPSQYAAIWVEGGVFTHAEAMRLADWIKEVLGAP